MLLPQKNTQFGSSAPLVLCVNSILSEKSILAVIPKWRVCFLFPAVSKFHFMLSLFCIIISRWVHTALFLLIYLFCFWLCWVCTAAHGLSLVAESRGFSRRGARASHCGGFPRCRAQAAVTGASVAAARGLISCGLQALERAGLSSCGQELSSMAWAAVAYGLSGSVACGILPDRGSSPCPLHWKADSYLLYHQGNPGLSLLKNHHDSSDFLY